ncbi:hypothetical protein APHAL10511_000596 [Amanita phalloides]|nr:hypothetical protein APHAL10511_000596 [Amanita phalloides]
MSNDTTGKIGLDPTVDFIAGALGGIAGLVVGHPFDTVKVRFQNPTLAGKYTSTAHAFVSIVREERFIGLYKGITSPLVTVALLNSLVFASYSFFLKIQLESTDAIPTLIQVLIAGALTGVVCCIVTTPTELIKIRQQEQLVPTSTWKIVLQIIKEDGILGLYRGVAATILRDLGYGAYFAAYEGTNRLFSQLDIKDIPWYGFLLSGGIAGIAGWVITFPFDVVKTRMQGTLNNHELDPARVTESTSLLPPDDDAITIRKVNPYQTVISTIINSYTEEGIGVFCQGLGAAVIRAIPTNMATFATFEGVSRVINSILIN